MSERNIRVIVLDDNESDREVFTEQGLEPAELTSIAPVADMDAMLQQLATLIQDTEFDTLAILDYRLDEPADIEYRGGTIASRIKEIRPDVPVAMLTSDEVMHAFVASNRAASAPFDVTFRKELFASYSEDRVGEISRSLATGFGDIRTSFKDGRAPSAVLIDAIDPPEAVELDGIELWLEAYEYKTSTSGLAGWILDILFSVQGPLFDLAETCAALGIDVDQVDEQTLQDLRATAGYQGVFAQTEQRFWRSQVEDARGSVSDGTVNLFGRDFQAAACTWCGGPVSRSCSSCRRGCDEAHALPLASQLARFGLPSIACFRCIAEGDVASELVDPSASDLVDLLVRGELNPSTND